MTKIAPSLLAANFTDLKSELKRIKDADYLHLDVMDGVFVPNISFGFDIIKQLRSESDLFFDVHLMIQHPEKYITQCIDSGADLITVHIEAVDEQALSKVVQEIKQANKKVGLSIKPGTDISEIYKYLTDIDVVLVMSVEPGFGGQKFMPTSLDKVRKLRQYKEEHKLNYLIEIDGGINDITGIDAVAAGVDILVAGSYIFNGDAFENITKLKGE